MRGHQGVTGYAGGKISACCLVILVCVLESAVLLRGFQYYSQIHIRLCGPMSNVMPAL